MMKQTKECSNYYTVQEITRHTYTNWDGEEFVEEEINSVERHTTRDLDTHRYQCTQCNKIMYYSNAARLYYEEGINSQIQGLSND